jgi:hypothetical protein
VCTKEIDTLRGRLLGLYEQKENGYHAAVTAKGLLLQRMRELKEEVRRCRDSQAASTSKIHASLDEIVASHEFTADLQALAAAARDIAGATVGGGVGGGGGGDALATMSSPRTEHSDQISAALQMLEDELNRNTRNVEQVRCGAVACPCRLMSLGATWLFVVVSL